MRRTTSIGAGAPQPSQLRFGFDPRTTMASIAGQRRRFAASVAALGPDELAAPSRCRGWTVADVLRHGVWADEAMRAIWAGRLDAVAGFDPRTTPHEFVAADRSVPDAEIQRRYLVSAEAMAADLLAATDDRFAQRALAPVGEVPWWISSMHLGWDTAVHERDVMLALGRGVEAPPDEAYPCLAYGLVLASFFAGAEPIAVRLGPVRMRRDDGPVAAWLANDDAAGDAADDAAEDDPDISLLEGDPMEAVDAMSGRGSLARCVSGPPEVLGRLEGLGRYFASAPAG